MTKPTPRAPRWSPSPESRLRAAKRALRIARPYVERFPIDTTGRAGEPMLVAGIRAALLAIDEALREP